MRTSIFRSALLPNLPLLLLLISLTTAHGLTDANTSIPGCPSSNCGDGVQIVYPFWVAAAGSTSFCGYPEFEITCKNTTPSFRTLSDNYTVRQIDAPNRTLSLVDSDVVGSSCPRARHNVTFSSDLIGNYNVTIPRYIYYFVFFFNCNFTNNAGFPPLLEASNITCLRDGTGTSYAFYGEDPALIMKNYSALPQACAGGTVISPVLNDALASSNPGKAFGKVLMGGFQVRWEEPAMWECESCEQSGGHCGYNNDTGDGLRFQCYCKDGVHHRSNCGASEPPVSGRSNKRALAIGSGTGGVIGLLILLAFLLFCYVFCFGKLEAEDKTVEEFLMRDQLFAVKRYRFSELKQITASFTETLGRGGFATVYKGKLRDGTPVAVKLLKDSGDTGEEFINEVASIGRTNHVNVVRLLGFCSAGPKRRALVYEFMPNGSLEKFLFNVEFGAPTPAPAVVLGWEKLHEIAVGIARGLEYLHRRCNTRIVHLDIKPHNILLDGNMQPKISDFGLARLCKPMESVLSSVIGARGTIGYIAPEVFSRTFGFVSGKSDVYSYGMMLLEMAGRRRNVRVDARNSSEVYFPHWIYEHLDECYGLETCQNSRECEIARKMALVGLWCIQMDPSARPSIVRVVEMLEGGVDELDMPPKPYMCSPDRSGSDLVVIDSSSTFGSNR